jgi:4-hydroxy-4-methyl-2-oxoglutarate aldolase
MSQWIERKITRPAARVTERLKRFPTGIVGDCMNRLQTMDAGIRPLASGWKLCGPAITVQSVESCNWGAHQALNLAQAGDVIVISARGGMNGAVWGHIMTSYASRKSLAGVVIDGCVRDFAENRADRLPIFCRGACPGGPHKGWPCNINVPVACAGVPVRPGDVVVGDDDGIVVVPAQRVEDVLAEAESRLDTEKSWYERIAGGESTLDVLNIKPV